MTEQDALAVWLRQRGISEHDVGVYGRALQAVREIIPSDNIDANQINRVLDIERSKGATQRRLDNLAYIGEKLVRFSCEIDSSQLIKHQPIELALVPEPRTVARGTPAPPVGLPTLGAPGPVEEPRSRRSTPKVSIPTVENRGDCTCMAGTKDMRAEEGADIVSRDLLAGLGIVCVALGMIKGIGVFLGIAGACAVVSFGLVRRLQGVRFLCLRCKGTIPTESPFEEEQVTSVANSLKLKLGVLAAVALAGLFTYYWMINHAARAVSG